MTPLTLTKERFGTTVGRRGRVGSFRVMRGGVMRFCWWLGTVVRMSSSGVGRGKKRDKNRLRLEIKFTHGEFFLEFSKGYCIIMGIYNLNYSCIIRITNTIKDPFNKVFMVNGVTEKCDLITDQFNGICEFRDGLGVLGNGPKPSF